jgi:uncharacterized protein DUF3987
VIQAFNQAHDVRELLKKHGYKPKGNDRFIAPGSTSGLASVKIFEDERVYSHHGSDPLADGHSHDAFSVYTLLDHRGDVKAAAREAARFLGIDSPGARTKRAEGNQRTATEEPPIKEGMESSWPDPEPIRNELLPVEPLRLAIIPEPFRPWVKDVSHRMQVPPDFIATGSIAMAASVIGAGCGIRPKHAMKNLEAPETPIWRRYRTNDTTVEKLGELLKENPHGLLIFRDELIGFLAALDREDRKSDRGFYLEAWNGYGSFLYDRIGCGTVLIENCCVSILGGIQPAKLLAYLHQAMDPIGNDGLLQRFQLLVYPDEPRSWELVDRCPDKAAKDRAFDVLKGLAETDFTNHGALLDEYTPCPYFQFEPKAQKVFDGWLGELEARVRGQTDDHPLLVEHLGKYRSLMPSPALIFHLIAVADGKAFGAVSLRAAEQAAAWCEYLESHARRVYGLAANRGKSAAYELSRRIHKGELKDGFTARGVYRKQWSLLTDKKTVYMALDELVEARWLRKRVTPPTFQQRQATSYLINPKAK